MINRQPAFAHHLFQITVRELVATIPAETPKDDRGLKLTPLEWGLSSFQDDNLKMMMNELDEEKSSEVISATQPQDHSHPVPVVSESPCFARCPGYIMANIFLRQSCIHV